MKNLFDHNTIYVGRGIMEKSFYLLAEKIKGLRLQLGWTQTELSKKMGLTRSSINSWEMGLSVPSTQYIVELAKIFNVSTDYLLGMAKGATINVDKLDEKEVSVLVDLVKCFLDKKKTN